MKLITLQTTNIATSHKKRKEKKTSFIKEKLAFGHLLLSFASFNNLDFLNHAKTLFDTVDMPRNSFMYTTMTKEMQFPVIQRRCCVVRSVCPDNFTFTCMCFC